ncbi:MULTISPECIES: hypothetical protein [unclassified Pseudomonas]|uniref:hypothetical protein n=1 Tax=unclassified Pseudomonas TaxID=196821 RepID=UPI00244CD07C|nr:MULTISPECIES: hypothetical protein [unclassified Pseudomonas]MDH0303456.1 hypothetical protein [Pseudomonas sp. GD04091]MDH1984477.1 hypothetical protein [Pseudomonas sp. GD03689]
MSWEKVGKSLVGLLVVAAVAAGLHAALGDDHRLQARLTYAHLTYPGQFNERVSQSNDLLKYERLHARISEIGAGTLDHAQIDKLLELAQAPYLQLFARPFEAGLVDHRTGLLIELANPGPEPAKVVQIRLPARGLVQMRDAAGNDTLVQAPTNLIEIPAIDGMSESKVWVYFDSDYSQIRQGGISIRSEDGSADIQVYREVIGFPAWLARYSQLVVGLFAVLLAGMSWLGYACLARRRKGMVGVARS